MKDIDHGHTPESIMAMFSQVMIPEATWKLGFNATEIALITWLMYKEQRTPSDSGIARHGERITINVYDAMKDIRWLTRARLDKFMQAALDSNMLRRNDEGYVTHGDMVWEWGPR